MNDLIPIYLSIATSFGLVAWVFMLRVVVHMIQDDEPILALAALVACCTAGLVGAVVVGLFWPVAVIVGLVGVLTR